MHVDRIDAVAQKLAGQHDVVGLEHSAKSEDYDWVSEDGINFQKQTLYADNIIPGYFTQVWDLWKAFRKIGKGNYFLCHYDWPSVFTVAWLLRLTGSRVITMGCSKFDDLPRHAWREYLKTWFLKPYHGAIASGNRSRDYMRFLGIPENAISGEYNTLSVERFRQNAGIQMAPGLAHFENRYFVAVARFVPKKNLFMLIDAYRIYCAQKSEPRDLHLCGSGELESSLRARIAEYGLEKKVKFRGFLQTKEVSKVLGGSLALLLPSIEEQFGNVVIEAQALGLPVILSENCGAHDKLVRSGVNGFVIEPDNPEGMAYFMNLLCSDQYLWSNMANAAFEAAAGGDVAEFAKAVQFHLDK